MPQEDLLQLTEHHRSPVSLDRKVRNNSIQIFDGVHKAWHYLFGNMAPELVLREIVRHWLPTQDLSLSVTIRTKFWSGVAQPIPYRRFVSREKQQAFALLFPTQSTEEILQLWAAQWVPPPDYFWSLEVQSADRNYHMFADTADSALITAIKHRQQCKLLDMMEDAKHI